MGFLAAIGYVDLTVGKTAALKAGVATAGEEAGVAGGGKLKSGLFGAVKNLAGPIIGIMALDKLFEFVKGGAQDWGVLQGAIRQTNAVLLSTGGAAQISGQGITDLTDKLSKKTAVDQATIRSGENMLLTFTNVRNEVGAGNDIFNQATGTILDMSKALGQDTKSSAIQLGKALNDPIKGVTALQRVGVTFDAQQKAQIKTMVASNNTMGAQKIILAELNKEFGGSAAAAATGGAKLSLTMKDLAMNLYGLFAPIKTVGITFSTWLVTPIADGIAKLVPIEQKWVADWKTTFHQAKAAAQDPLVDFPKQSNPLEQLARLVGVVIGNINQQLQRGKELFHIFFDAMRGDTAIKFSHELGGVGQAAGTLGDMVHNAYMKFKPFIDEFGPIAAKAAALSGAFLVIATILPTLVGWISKLSIVVGILGKALGLLAKNPLLVTLSLLVGAFYALYQVSPAFREFISNMIDKFGVLSDLVLPRVEIIFNALMDTITTVLTVVMPYVDQFISTLGDGVQAILGFFGGAQQAQAGGGFVAWIQNAFNTVKSIFDAAVGWISGVANAIGGWLSYMFSPLAPLIPKVERLLSLIGDRFNDLWQHVLGPFFSWLGPVVGATFQAIWSILEPILTTIGALFGTVFHFIGDVIVAVFGLITDIIRGALEIIGGIIGLFLDIITGNWSGVWGDLAMIVNGFVDIFMGIITFGLNIVKAVFTGVMGLIVDIVQGAWNFLIGIFTGALQLINGIVGGGLDNVINWFRGIGKSISNAIGDLGGLLMRAGQAIIDGFLAGIKAAWKAVTDFVGGIAQWIADHKGPISYDKTLLLPHGKAIMQGLLSGLQSESASIEQWLGTFTDNLAVSANIGVTSSVRGSGLNGAGTGGSGGSVYNVYANDDPHSTAAAIDRIQTNAARVA